MPVDLADAVLEQLRASECAALFGDTWVPTPGSDGQGAGVQKFFNDFAAQTVPAYPYLVIGEGGETREYMTYGPGNYAPFIADGQMSIQIYNDARDEARELGEQVASALNDAVLSWPRCVNFMYLRFDGPGSFVPLPQPGVGSPTVFLYSITFNYTYQGFTT